MQGTSIIIKEVKKTTNYFIANTDVLGENPWNKY